MDKQLIALINNAIDSKFGSKSYGVTFDKRSYVRLNFITKNPDEEPDMEETNRVASFIFCNFLEVKEIAWGGVCFTRESLLRYAFQV